MPGCSGSCGQNRNNLSLSQKCQPPRSRAAGRRNLNCQSNAIDRCLLAECRARKSNECAATREGDPCLAQLRRCAPPNGCRSLERQYAANRAKEAAREQRVKEVDEGNRHAYRCLYEERCAKKAEACAAKREDDACLADLRDDLSIRQLAHRYQDEGCSTNQDDSFCGTPLREKLLNEMANQRIAQEKERKCDLELLKEICKCDIMLGIESKQSKQHASYGPDYYEFTRYLARVRLEERQAESEAERLYYEDAERASRQQCQRAQAENYRRLSLLDQALINRLARLSCDPRCAQSPRICAERQRLTILREQVCERKARFRCDPYPKCPKKPCKRKEDDCVPPPACAKLSLLPEC